MPLLDRIDFLFEGEVNGAIFTKDQKKKKKEKEQNK